jgi:hypothetical protein
MSLDYDTALELLADEAEAAAEQLADDEADWNGGVCPACDNTGNLPECGACEGCLLAGEGGRFGGRRPGCGGACSCSHGADDFDPPEPDDRHAGEGEVAWESPW